MQTRTEQWQRIADVDKTQVSQFRRKSSSGSVIVNVLKTVPLGV